MRARHTTDPAHALENVSEFLASDPVANSVVIGLLGGARRLGRRAPTWWVEGDDGRVCGTLAGSGDPMPAILGPMSDAAASSLASASAESLPVRQVNGPASAVATFAGAFATLTGAPARPVGGERVYEASAAEIVGDPAGVRRPAAAPDFETIVEFVAGFGSETGTGPGGEAEHRKRAAAFIEAGRLHVWEVDGALVSSAVVMPPEHGVSRVAFVYTPADLRGRGYASRLVSELTVEILSAGARPILYTQLENPISNRVYQRIGYVPVAEHVRYEFDLPSAARPARV